uniref:Malate dehydrogenase, cytoplasmic n=1 Tax=Taenia solium TaxID=6204 RepID=MDHC_TAESO|nr:RecName: Full=Malate dehydrogenase, cytoplasmic; AltName: Full=Cytosolic malate dehydrogenase [Taenia solium]ADX42057.1 cytosolic malate dehydrogenase [Taenia solium]|eukprot:TsM_000048200 transcript=TsM_000048200 gene=TsM_000048200
MPGPLRVLITGAAGQIAYNLSNMVANGNLFGKDQKIILHLLDIPEAKTVLEGVVMELQDCAFTVLEGIVPTHCLKEAFTDIDVALMVGAMPRKQGMERRDLLSSNVKIFKDQGEALEKYAKKTVKVLVVGNPANTNCLIMSKYAPSIPKENFTALSRLDHNRAIYQVAAKVGVPSECVKNVCIWGNHSNKQFPDLAHAVVTKGGKQHPAKELINDEKWVKEVFTPCVQNRGAAVIGLRKLSSAASAAKAIVDQMHDWWFGTKEGEWVSMSVYSTGEHYGAPKDIYFSFPVTIKNGHYKVVDGLAMDEWGKGLFKITADELVDEREVALSSFK